jgi:hypothetical protein
MLYLIDGYNLLHALGFLHGGGGGRTLEWARRHLLDWLRQAHADDPSAVTVVFDAAHAPPNVPTEQDHQGLQVVFAVGLDQADDLLEQLIRKASVPRRLTVVSSDHRVQAAGRRRHCVVLGCNDYLDALERRGPHRQPATPPAPAKPDSVSGAETEYWLERFDVPADEEDG